MRRSKTLERIRRGEHVRMCCLGHYIPSYIKQAAFYGYDCIWLDLEHRGIPDRDVQNLLTHSHLHDIDIMLRPPTLEKTRLYRYLEDGATGLMIPHVNTAEKAQMLVEATKFPPLGDRGLDGAGLDANYMVDGADVFTAEANRETFLVVQVETPEAIANVEAIAAVPGLDGIFVGPGDLGLRLKYDQTGLTLDAAFSRVAAACRANGKFWGSPAGTKEILHQRQRLGAQLMNFGGEFVAIMKMLEECVTAFDMES
ncbi:MAG: HpcH/HpaI aldolase family protein [Planctomycetota bacterium]